MESMIKTKQKFDFQSLVTFWTMDPRKILQEAHLAQGTGPLGLSMVDLICTFILE